MDSKTKLYVFTRIEVFLIFLFMICISVTSFLLGVKVGDHYSFVSAGYKPEDKARVEFLSKKEEELKKIEGMEIESQNSEDVESQLKEKINQEFGNSQAQAGAHGTTHGTAPITSTVDSHTTATTTTPVTEAPQSSPAKATRDQLAGLFTVQLGSHRTLKEAEDFALGFKARGYDPIISEYNSKDKGTWFRVSLGAFKTLAEARTYVGKEKSLLQGQDYAIIKMP
jgi:cell division protein FtsN